MRIAKNRIRNRIQGLAVAAMTLILGLGASGSTFAATCKDELDRFEYRLRHSSMEAKDPATFRALARQAEEAAELRDERQCLETVAALNDVVPEDAEVATGASEDSRASGPAKSTGTRSRPSRPAAPVLMIAGDDDAGEADEERKPAASGSDDQDDSLND
jgi:hypothetical protein